MIFPKKLHRHRPTTMNEGFFAAEKPFPGNVRATRNPTTTTSQKSLFLNFRDDTNIRKKKHTFIGGQHPIIFRRVCRSFCAARRASVAEIARFLRTRLLRKSIKGGEKNVHPSRGRFKWIIFWKIYWRRPTAGGPVLRDRRRRHRGADFREPARHARCPPIRRPESNHFFSICRTQNFWKNTLEFMLVFFSSNDFCGTAIRARVT